MYLLKSTKFPKIMNVSWMKPDISSSLVKTYKTQEILLILLHNIIKKI